MTTTKLVTIRTLTNLKTPLDIIYKTDSLLVVNKPIDVRIDGDFDLTLAKMVNEQLPEFRKKENDKKFRIRFCHRLDFATSGIICMGFTQKTTSIIAECFESRKSVKEYLALVFGHLKEDKFTIDEKVGEDPLDERGFLMCITEKGRDSLTEGVVLSRGYYCEQKVSKVILYPKTGRRHQLRVHMKHIGHPIVGKCHFFFY
jgi:23S rRNA-/tRNA-specific pseudouridylate synthase